MHRVRSLVEVSAQRRSRMVGDKRPRPVLEGHHRRLVLDVRNLGGNTEPAEPRPQRAGELFGSGHTAGLAFTFARCVLADRVDRREDRDPVGKRDRHAVHGHREVRWTRESIHEDVTGRLDLEDARGAQRVQRLGAAACSKRCVLRELGRGYRLLGVPQHHLQHFSPRSSSDERPKPQLNEGRALQVRPFARSDL